LSHIGYRDCPQSAEPNARTADKVFFIYGFAKNERANVIDRELKALKLLAEELLNYPVAL
jgi:hypothetical protein